MLSIFYFRFEKNKKFKLTKQKKKLEEMRVLLILLLLATFAISSMGARESDNEPSWAELVFNFFKGNTDPDGFKIRGKLRPCVWKICSRPLRKSYMNSKSPEQKANNNQEEKKFNRIFRIKVVKEKMSIF